MKILNYLLLFICTYGVAQIQTPQPSPITKIEQVVGLTNVSLEYSRPSMRGRKIMGDLVPMGEMWRAGANKNSMIRFSDAVKVSGKNLEAGTYSLFVRPGTSMWEVFFYTQIENWGLPSEWDINSIAATVEVKTEKLSDAVES